MIVRGKLTAVLLLMRRLIMGWAAKMNKMPDKNKPVLNTTL